MGQAVSGRLHRIVEQQITVDDGHESNRSRIARGNLVEDLLGRRDQSPNVH